MRAGVAIKILLTIIAMLAATSLYTTDRALYYREHPRVKIEQHNSIIYDHFDPNRSSAYTCITQKVTKSSIGMVCGSPDGNIEIDCTVAGDPNQYFC